MIAGCFGGSGQWRRFEKDWRKALHPGVYDKITPVPNVSGSTEFERFDNAFRKVLTVSKEDLLKAEAK